MAKAPKKPTGAKKTVANLKHGEATRTIPSSQPVLDNLRHGFVYERVPHITLKSIANNAEIESSGISGRLNWSRCARR